VGGYFFDFFIAQRTKTPVASFQLRVRVHAGRDSLGREAGLADAFVLAGEKYEV
jgi:hypothetical protein